ncbi:RNA-binding protein 33-like [Uloborus diversus]|uniref:RNA-binding protein 33-like n=1 Tax=Uloborus diversus TaxID=327109 RepID=UPI00240A3398|nr:RNA-binding protein 33-like [Uloborus diversus]
MDDDLLADDGQFKDDSLDELDIDEEAALLGLSDEEIEGDRSEPELQYVDEEGNIVDMGENNAELYEVANVQDTDNPQADDDVLELDLDAELDAFTRENPDLAPRESPVSKSYNDRHFKENLISISTRNEKAAVRPKEQRISPEIREHEKPKSDTSYQSTLGHSSRSEALDSYPDELEYDEESEDESLADDHRERFKSERSNIITLTPGKRRSDIPDTLESVISVEETAKVQAFLENEQKRKMRFKGRNQNHQRNQPRNFSRAPQNFQNMRPQHMRPQNMPSQSMPLQSMSSQSMPSQNMPPQSGPPQNMPPQNIPPQNMPPQNMPPQNMRPQNVPPQSMPPQQMQQYPPSTSTAAVQQNVNAPAQPGHKILVNPHFRGVRMPPPATTEPAHTANDIPVSHPAPVYENPQNFPPPPSYSHHEAIHPAPMGPPVYNAPPPTHAAPYKHPEYPPPQQVHQQPPMPVWQPPPEIPQHIYSNPPPVMNYSEPAPQIPTGYHNFNQNNYQNNFQPSPLQQQPLSYGQPPAPPVHLPPTTYSSAPPINHMPGNNTYTQFSANQQTYTSTNQPYQERSSSQRQPVVQTQRSKFVQNQRFPRQPEKRTSPSNVKPVPLKQPRLDHPQRKINVHVNPNIREIPLVDTLPRASPQKPPVKKSPVVVEEEDEKTKELRMKIEEQKLLREQLLKRKEERRREMAAQRLLELKKRQAEQGKTVTSIPLKPIQNNQQNSSTVQTASQQKISVKNRIGLPAARAVPTKKKIIVVRKKIQQNTNNFTNQAKVGVTTQKMPVTAAKPLQNAPQKQNISLNNANKTQTPLFKKVILQPTANSNKNVTMSAVKKDNQQIKAPIVSPTAKVEATKVENTLKTKKQINVPLSPKKAGRLGNRPGPQRQPFHPPINPQLQRMPPPRFSSPRGPHFNPRLMEPRMRFPNRNMHMNDMRLPLRPPFQERHPSFQDARPPLLPFIPNREHGPFNHFPHPEGRFDPRNPHFRMNSPDFQNFQHADMDMFHERFPPPQFQGRYPEMRQIPGENQGPMFHKPRFQNANFRPRISPNKQSQNLQNKKTNQSEINATKKLQAETTGPVKNANSNQNSQEGKKIIQIQQQKKNISEVSDGSNTRVSVENLSSSTTEVQLKKLCSSVGVVQNIQLLKSERKAIIKFKESKQAINFQQKYQRYMLDLAMIQVSLLST